MEKIKRDEKSNAVIIDDLSGLNNYKKARQKRRKDDKRIEELENEINFIKNILKEKNII